MNKPSLFELSAFASAMSTSATPRVQPGNKLVRRKPSPLALEQRFMFDGAAVGDAVQMLASPSVDASAPADAPLADGHAAAADWLRFANVTVDSASPLAAAEIAAERLVAEFLQRPDAHEQLFSLFNGGQAEPSAEWQQAADSFLTAMQNGEVSVRVELRSNAELQGAKGAFSATGTTGQHTIYLNADWLAGNPDAGIGAADSASITKVLVEELGHSIDATLNGAVDTAGDEGEVFARVVVDGANPLSVSFLSAQDDRGQLTIDGQSVVAEFANLNFSNAYAMVYDLDNSGAIVGSTGETEAAKEQSSHNFNAASLGIATINDDTNSNLFSGNDVSAVGLNIGGTTYYGWISRPIKSGGVIRGFYFWTDPQFVNLATAQADGNQDGDSNALDNKGFLLVVDQTWFTSQISSTATTVSTAIDNTSLRTYSNVKSSSDRVDSALNALLAAQPVNTAPVANNDAANGTPGTSGGAALEQGYNSNTNTTITATVNATGNVLTNDVDTDGDTLTVSKIVSGSTGTTASVTGSTNVVGQYGTLTIGTNGAYSYAVDNSNATVNALLAGNVSEAFTYTVSDGKGGAASATLTVQINGSNDAPVAANDYGTAKEFLTGVTGSGYTATGNVLPNDTDVDAGDTKAINGLSLSGAATIGNVAVTQGATELIFIGGSGFNSVNAGQELYVSLTGAVGAGATYYGVYNFNGSTYTLVNVASKTTVTGGDAIQLNFDPTHYWNGSGYVAISNIGTFLSTYSNVLFENSTTQTENSNGGKEATVSSSSSLGYTTLSSLSGISGTVAVGMSVSGTGVPVGTKVSELVYSAGMLTSIKLDQELTATTGGGFTFSSSGATGVDLIGAHGKLNLAANGAYTYTPNTDNTLLSVGESAVEVFDYTMRDTVGVTSSAKLYITVYGSGTNDPVLTNDAVSATESGVVTGGNTVTAGTDATGNVLSNDKESAAAGTNVIGTAYVNRVGLLGSVSFTTIDTAANGRTTSQSAAVIGTYGTLTISDLGAYTYAINNANSTVNALLPGQALTETFVYEVKNTLSSSGPSWAKLVVTINGTNDAPVAVVDTGAVSEDNVLTNSGNVLTNDTDVDSGDTKTVSKAIAGAIAPTTAVTAGTTSVNGLSIGGTYGTLVLGADGTYLYTLATSGDATRYSALQALINGTVVNEVFTYEVKDTNGATSNATLTISVTGANEPPVNQFNGATFSSSTTTSVTTAMDTAITFTGSQLLSVADADNNLSRIVLNVDHGTLAVILSGAATISGGATGTAYLIISGTQVDINATLASLIYTPGLNFVGSDFLTIMSQDALNVTDSDGIAINIPTVFTGPTVLESDLASGSNAAGMGESATATLLAPSGQTFGATAQSGTDTYGTWTLNVGTGVFTYNLTSAPSVSGASSTRSINVTTYDATGNAVTNTVTVTVTDDVATANADVRSVTEGSTASPAPNITGNVYASGVAGDVADVMGADGSSNPVVKVIAGTGTPATAVAASSTSASGGTVVTGSYGTLTIGANGSYIYDLDDTNATVDALNTGSSLSEVFTYQIADGDGDVSNATLTITINGLSDGTPSLSINDVTVNEAAGTATFTVTRSGSSVATASVSYATSDGTATAGSDYTAITATTLNFAIGETSKTIAVSITDDSTAESSETFNVTLSAASGATISDAIGVGTITDNDSGNTAPVAKNNTYTATEDVLLTARNIITDNDGTAGTDSDAESNPLTIAKVNGTAFASLAGGTDPAHLAADGWKQVALTNGTLFIKSDGTTEYQPAVNSTAGDSFTYTASDGTAESGSATVSFSVTAVNDDYTDADETLSVAEDSAATTGNLLSGTSSVDG
ncbi:MAG: VCBS domain-containing protein, partial [Gammaproteobacteria bacterium]|nr:VCBS domain-containing protein [Gammaproteobacteria bacterium]